MPEKNFSISITSATIVKTLLILAGAWLLYELSDLVIVMLTAIVIASAIEPAAQWFMRKRIPRVAAVLIVYGTFVAGAVSLFYFFLPLLLSEVATLVASLSTYADTFARAPGEYVPLLNSASGTGMALQDLVEQTRSMVQNFSQDAFSAASSVFGGVMSLILIFVFSFYFTLQEKGIEDFLKIVTPAKHESYILDLWRRSQYKIGLWMQGQLLLALVVGVLVYLGLTILGIKHALLLAVVAGAFEIIPLFGPTLSSIPAIAIALTDGGVTLAIGVVFLYVIIQQFENHLIYPLVVTKVVGVPPLMVILGLIIGAKLAGFLGMLLSAPMAAIVQELISDIDARRGNREASPPVA
ncbi:MAG: AI-2E family transporter [Patescibacteria group bacterium]|mgnify:CR=1 FL=1